MPIESPVSGWQILNKALPFEGSFGTAQLYTDVQQVSSLGDLPAVFLMHAYTIMFIHVVACCWFGGVQQHHCMNGCKDNTTADQSTHLLQHLVQGQRHVLMWLGHPWTVLSLWVIRVLLYTTFTCLPWAHQV